jgi:uncharacterized coiled-coil protein SlyX
MGLEGLVSKRSDRPYRPLRGDPLPVALSPPAFIGRARSLIFSRSHLPRELNWEDHGREKNLLSKCSEDSERQRVIPMVDVSYSRLKQQLDPTVVRVLAAALAVILIGAGCAMIWGFGSGSVALPPSATAIPVPAHGQVSDEILETAKGLQVTQQQAIDQLQVVQDQLAAQKAETKKLSEQMAAMTEKLDALQQSVASMPAPPVAAPISPARPRHQ